jgi:hypothetical protein
MQACKFCIAMKCRLTKAGSRLVREGAEPSMIALYCPKLNLNVASTEDVYMITKSYTPSDSTCGNTNRCSKASSSKERCPTCWQETPSDSTCCNTTRLQPVHAGATKDVKQQTVWVIQAAAAQLQHACMHVLQHAWSAAAAHC